MSLTVWLAMGLRAAISDSIREWLSHRGLKICRARFSDPPRLSEARKARHGGQFMTLYSARGSNSEFPESQEIL